MDFLCETKMLPIVYLPFLSGQQTANLSAGSMLQEKPAGQFLLFAPLPQNILSRGLPPLGHVGVAKKVSKI